jgi:hypothetical protein
MHGFRVRVVAVTNIDLEFMSRRTPTDSAVRVEVTDGSGSEHLPEWDCASCDHRRSGISVEASILLPR